MSTARTAESPSIGWMLGTSTWMISAFIPGSYLAWLGFLIVGIVGRMMRWTVVGIVLGALAIVVHLPIWGQWQSLLAALVYIAGMLMALMANPGWLRAMWARRTGADTSSTASSTTQSDDTRASRRARERQKAAAAADAARAEASAREEERRKEQRRKATRSRGREDRGDAADGSSSDVRATSGSGARIDSARKTRSEADQLAARAGASSTEFFAAPSAAEPADPIDVNTADAGELANLPGISARQARRLVKQRTEQGGFASLDAFATAAGLQPHELVRLRSDAVCSRPPRGPRQFGRRVDY